MNRYKKLLCILLTVIFAINLSACSLDALPEGSSLSERLEKFILIEIFDQDPADVEYMYASSSYVVFFEEEDAKGVYVPLADIVTYETQYPDCSGTWYRDQLNGEALQIYNAYLYAMEHSYKGFSLYVQDNEQDFWYIRDLLALDSPLLEQNYDVDGEYTRSWEADDYGERIYFHAEQFNKESWSLKATALERCRQIVAQIPAEYQTTEEKMLYLYHYVCDQITYTEYTGDEHSDYLYDAVCIGKTNCDGYSNMLSLLFNLIGVDACEISGHDAELPEDATDEERAENGGHTWVAAKLGEHYYHFDPTFEDTTIDMHDSRMIYFGVSDAMASSSIIEYEDNRPKCLDKSRDLAFTQLTMQNISDDSEITNLAKLTDQRAKQKEYTTYVSVIGVYDSKAFDSMLNSYIQKVTQIHSVSATYIEINGNMLMRVNVTPW